MRILVLGATGHTGQHILDLGLARGHRLTAFVRSPQKITRREDALTVVRGDPLGRQRNLPWPLQGAARIAAFVAAASGAVELDVAEHELNGQPAIVFWTGDRPFAALLLAVANAKIQRVFFHADLDRLRYVGHRSATSSRSSGRLR